MKLNLHKKFPISKPIGNTRSPFSWSRYWLTRNFHVVNNTRNGLALVDTFGNNPLIKPAYFNKPLTTQYAYCIDNGALDIGATDFTWCFRFKGTDKTAAYIHFGKSIGAVVNGRYGFQSNATTGYGVCFMTVGATTKTITSSVDICDGNEHLLLGEIDQAAKIFRFYIDGTQIDADVSFTGSFAAVDNKYYFCTGCGNHSTGGGTMSNASKDASYADGYVFNKILTPTEKATLLAKGYVSGYKAYWPCISNLKYIYDAGGNYPMTIIGGGEGLNAFDSFGSTYGLNYGYRLYKTGYGDDYVPLKGDGTGIASLLAGAKLHSIHAGSATTYNLCNSNLLMVGDSWDRSSATLFEDVARDTEYGYKVEAPKEWHISLINNLVLQSWGKAGQKHNNICRFSDCSYKTRTKLEEIMSFSESKSDADYNKIVNSYCKETAFVDTYENDYIYWKESTDSVIALNGAKQLKYDVTDHKVYLSLDDGDTWSASIAVPGDPSYLQMGVICDNGNIAFATASKIYLSTDNLATINEVVPKSITGADFTPAATDNYTMFNAIKKVTIGAATLYVWNNYTTSAASQYINVNVWYTADNFATIKSCYLANTTLAPAAALAARHGHGVYFNPNDSTFWATYGDGTNECNIIQGTYTVASDTWAWTKIYGDNDGGSAALTNNSFYKLTGINFVGSDIYWASDSDGATRKGLYKSTYAGFNDTANYVKILDTNAQDVCLSINNGKAFSRGDSKARIITSTDLTGWIQSKIYSITPHATLPTIAFELGVDSNGWHIVTMITGSETLSTFLLGNTLKVKIK